MGKIDLKLLQGIEETESQINEEKYVSRKQEEDKSKVAEKNHDNEEIAFEKNVMPKVPNQRNSKSARKGKPKGDIIAEKCKKQVFSFRAQVSDIKRWKNYAMSHGDTMENIGTAALNEFIARHKLTGSQLAIYNALNAREDER